MKTKRTIAGRAFPPSDYSSLSTYRVNQIEMIPAAAVEKKTKKNKTVVRESCIKSDNGEWV